MGNDHSQESFAASAMGQSGSTVNSDTNSTVNLSNYVTLNDMLNILQKTTKLQQLIQSAMKSKSIQFNLSCILEKYRLPLSSKLHFEVIAHYIKQNTFSQNKKSKILINDQDQNTIQYMQKIYKDTSLCKQYIKLILDCIKLTLNPLYNLYIMEYYINECLKELNNTNPMYLKPENYGLCAVDEPPLSNAAVYIIHEVLPSLTEYLLCIKPDNTSIFAIQHYFKKVLILCKRCIELDIECFKLLEYIFGFMSKDPTKKSFYDNCGLPKSSFGDKSKSPYRPYAWDLSKYGNGEFSKSKKKTHSNVFTIQSKFEKTEMYCNPNSFAMSYYNDYPIEDLKYCGELSNVYTREQSWFQIDNINFFGKIGGFDAILNRISFTKCCVTPSNLVNILRPIAVLRDIFNRDYYNDYCNKYQIAIGNYYDNLPNEVVRCLNVNLSTIETQLKNMHYFMNKDFKLEIINEMKIKLLLKICLRQFNAPYATSRILSINRINYFIDIVIGNATNASINNNDNIYINYNHLFVKLENIINADFMKQWLLKHNILKQMLNSRMLVGKLSSIFQLFEYDNSKLDLSQHIVPFIWLIMFENKDESLPLYLKELHWKYCGYLTGGYMKQFSHNVTNDICQIIFFFLCKKVPVVVNNS